MKAALLRRIAINKLRVDNLLKAQTGTFNRRSPKELDQVFGLSYSDLKTTQELILPEPDLGRIPQSSQEFLVNAMFRYNSTFKSEEGMSKDIDGFKGNEITMQAYVEYYLRTLIMCSYEEGVSVTSGERIVMDMGLHKGHHDFVIKRGGFPIIVFRLVRENNHIKGLPIEQAFTSNIFEVYSAYWKNPVWPLYGCICDLNSWIFIKYDGEFFYRSSKTHKLALHSASILSLAAKILSIIDSKT
ncbi:hypothetical protein SteCoe_11581 [Stentor coeruleus]|uniref:Uncharacterized protein n=1 Tax=Stentor coeruleus TaxID=5963 RepID=A0A1R2CCW9_9CILI|nr:hypothetical protein SteCoe_11581 [Stentor coeruleus]